MKEKLYKVYKDNKIFTITFSYFEFSLSNPRAVGIRLTAVIY